MSLREIERLCEQLERHPRTAIIQLDHRAVRRPGDLLDADVHLYALEVRKLVGVARAVLPLLEGATGCLPTCDEDWGAFVCDADWAALCEAATGITDEPETQEPGRAGA